MGKHNPEVPTSYQVPSISVKLSDFKEEDIKKYLEELEYVVEKAEDEHLFKKFLEQRDYAVIHGDADDVADWLKKRGYDVTHPLDKPGVTVTLTGSIQDADLAEAVAEAHQKHGHKLAELIRSL